MELYKEILVELSKQQEIAVDSVCYRALKKIKEILQDDTLKDEECFQQIEVILCVLEEIGSNGGCRHDF